VSALRVSGVSKAFAGVSALADVSFEARAGRVHCLLGGNGSGKSTLVKLLAGVQAGDAGEIAVRDETVAAANVSPEWARAHHLWFVHQDLAVFPALSVAENLAAGTDYPTTAGRIRWRSLIASSAEIAARFHLDVDPRTPLAALRPAQRTMVAIARALHRGQGTPGVIVLDEPTSALPKDEAEFLLDAIRRYAGDGHALVFVTHRLDEAVAAADDVTVLRDGRVVASRPADLTRAELAHLIVGEAPAHVAARQVITGDGPPVLELPEQDVVVRAGEIVGLAGRLGSGRTRLLRGVFGASPRDGDALLDGTTLPRGDVAAAMREGVAYVPEDRDGEGLFTTMDVRENTSAVDLRRFWSRGHVNHGAEGDAARDTMTSFLVRAVSDRQPIMTLSGGNRQKVLLARWMRTRPRLLLLDEPSQGVDVGARAEIHRLVRAAAAAGTATLVASSDHDELEQLCDRVLVMHEGRVVAELRPPDLTAARISMAALDAVPTA
jgi:ABC-type sugar transport system ATPase subunit